MTEGYVRNTREKAVTRAKQIEVTLGYYGLLEVLEPSMIEGAFNVICQAADQKNIRVFTDWMVTRDYPMGTEVFIGYERYINDVLNTYHARKTNENARAVIQKTVEFLIG